MSEIRLWLEGLGLGQYAEAFEAEQIDFEALSEVTEADLKEMGLPIGPRRKVIKAVRKHTEEVGAGIHEAVKVRRPGVGGTTDQVWAASIGTNLATSGHSKQ